MCGKYVDEMAAKKSAGVTPEVNQRCPLDAGTKHARNQIYPGFKTQWYQWTQPRTDDL